MPKIKFLVLFLLLTGTLYAQELNCAKFKNGTFKVINGTHTTIIKRLGGKQTEMMDGKLLGDFIVNWVDECTYTLTPTIETLKKQPGMPHNSVLTVRIINTSANAYTQITTANISKMSITSQVIKVD